MEKEVANYLLDEVKKLGIDNKKDLNRLKNRTARELKLPSLPTDIEISQHLSAKDREDYKHLFSTKPIRTLAGVAPVALMTKPHKCPHGTCVYCPGGPNSPFGDVPQAYTGTEPATRRAIRNHYDPYLQVMNRLEHYVVLNQVPEKVEIIVMGGTFLSLHDTYQTSFILNVFKAMNDFSDLFYKDGELNVLEFNSFFEMDKNKDDVQRQERIQEKLYALKEKNVLSLEEEQERNETSDIRCVSLVIETGAEACEVDQLLRLGCTRVELGVQSVYPEVVKAINRGHTSQMSIDVTKQLKDAAFKITYHMMPGLPQENMVRIDYEKDLEGLKELFKNPDWQPDMLKIYPCMVMRGTELYSSYESGVFKPLGTKEAAQMLVDFTPSIPDYVRIMRIQRDIPTYMTESGVDRTNLRQYVDELRLEQGIACRCIRCREIGRKPAKGEVHYRHMEYDASGGKEVFIAAEIEDSLIGFARLRFPDVPTRKEINKQTGLLRELHVYGQATELGEEGKVQHKGVGKKLMEEAEKLAKDAGMKKMIVISGIGVKEYYKNIGYHKEGPYMAKEL